MNKYLKTLKKIPDDIVLSMATREFNMVNPCTCICGWALREAIMQNGEEDDICGVIGAVSRFGGTYQEWSKLSWDSYNKTELVEEAFVERLNLIKL